MKKFLAVIALVAFLGGMSAPVIANDNASAIAIELADKDPKKAEKKSGECGEKKAKSSCGDAKKAECEKKCGDK